eukprot:5843351-Pleurochrysis_carterae.AAC.3
MAGWMRSITPTQTHKHARTHNGSQDRAHTSRRSRAHTPPRQAKSAGAQVILWAQCCAPPWIVSPPHDGVGVGRARPALAEHGLVVELVPHAIGTPRAAPALLHCERHRKGGGPSRREVELAQREVAPLGVDEADAHRRGEQIGVRVERVVEQLKLRLRRKVEAEPDAEQVAAFVVEYLRKHRRRSRRPERRRRPHAAAEGAGTTEQRKSYGAHAGSSLSHDASVRQSQRRLHESALAKSSMYDPGILSPTAKRTKAGTRSARRGAGSRMRRACFDWARST